MKRVTAFGVASVALLTLAACTGTKETSPTAPTPTPNVTATSVTITNTTSANSSSFQLTATARMSDGSTRDVTTASAWTTSNAALATVSSTGVLTVVGGGDVEVRATYQNVMGSLMMSVGRPPTGTAFVLSGTVREAMPTTHPVANARIVITGGAATGRFVVSDDSGAFRFDNVPEGVIMMEATRDGYQLWRVANLEIDRDRVVDVVLFPNAPKSAAGESATARCNDGTWSWAPTRADACTANGGIAYGVCPGPLCDGRQVAQETARKK